VGPTTFRGPAGIAIGIEMLLINEGNSPIQQLTTCVQRLLALIPSHHVSHGDGAPSGASSRKLVAHVLANLERSHPAHNGTYALAGLAIRTAQCRDIGTYGAVASTRP
jgi:hypothetical protein